MIPSYSWSRYDEIPFERDKLFQARLDIRGSRRTNALPWRGQFSPELAEYLVGEFFETGTIVDPFCGSGTTLIEAARLGYASVGSEVNPAAYLLSRVYELTALPDDLAKKLCSQVLLDAATLEANGAQFQAIIQWAMAAETYPEKILRDATALLAAGNTADIKAGQLNRAALRVASLVQTHTNIEASIQVELCDARRLPLPRGAATGLLTSPPYINVFNYHQHYRAAVEALGWGVLSSARAEFGSNRKHRQNRFLTVIQYAQDIAQALQESMRVLQPGSIAIWVVGRQSRVRGVPMPNPLIVFEAATQSGGFSLVSKRERSFTSRYGERVYEDVLIFRRTDDPEALGTLDLVERGRKIGASVLLSSLPIADEAHDEVEEAIMGGDRVFPSRAPEFTRPANEFVGRSSIPTSA